MMRIIVAALAAIVLVTTASCDKADEEKDAHDTIAEAAHADLEAAEAACDAAWTAFRTAFEAAFGEYLDACGMPLPPNRSPEDIARLASEWAYQDAQ